MDAENESARVMPRVRQEDGERVGRLGNRNQFGSCNSCNSIYSQAYSAFGPHKIRRDNDIKINELKLLLGTQFITSKSPIQQNK